MRPALAVSLIAAPLIAACSSSPAVGDGEVVRYLRAQPPDRRAAIWADAEQRTRATDVITRGGQPLTLVGPTLDVGAPAPDVTLLDSQLAPWRLADQRGKVVVLSVVPSIDTRVCEAQTHHVSDAIAELPPGTVVVTVSRDLPFAQQRFAEEAHTQTVMASDAKGREFGRRFGLEVDESGLLARSTWVIDKAGTIAYRELVADQTTEPAYPPLIAAAQAAAAK
ncbi:MAG: thiol peroxidase [Kofleriaceae bacterium]|nr:thiol peroxidase [Kofleriaceae bacterium]